MYKIILIIMSLMIISPLYARDIISIESTMPLRVQDTDHWKNALIYQTEINVLTDNSKTKEDLNSIAKQTLKTAKNMRSVSLLRAIIAVHKKEDGSFLDPSILEDRNEIIKYFNYYLPTLEREAQFANIEQKFKDN